MKPQILDHTHEKGASFDKDLIRIRLVRYSLVQNQKEKRLRLITFPLCGHRRGKIVTEMRGKPASREAPASPEPKDTPFGHRFS